MVGTYTQWLVSKSGIKEDLNSKSLARKLKDRVDDLSEMSHSTNKSISEPKTTVAAAKKAEDQAAIKVGALNK